MTTKNRQVCESFVAGGNASSKNLFIENVNNKNVLYSYGKHHPVATMIGGTYFVNETKYSMSTTRHTNECINAIRRFHSTTSKQIIYLNTREMESIINFGYVVKERTKFPSDFGSIQRGLKWHYKNLGISSRNIIKRLKRDEEAYKMVKQI